jgi:hypothetical protein
VATRHCPQCGTEAPASALRCKQCFHEYGGRSLSFGPVVVLGVIAVMTFVAAVAFFVAGMGPVDERVLVSAETKSIVIATKYSGGPETQRIPFSDVATLEHRQVTEGYEVVATTTKGESRVIHSGHEPLYMEAERYSAMIGKPYTRVGEIVAPEAPAPH